MSAMAGGDGGLGESWESHSIDVRVTSHAHHPARLPVTRGPQFGRRALAAYKLPLSLTMSSTRTTETNGAAAAYKRRRTQRSSSPQYKLDDDDTYDPYISVAQRKQAKLAKLTSWGAGSDRDKANKLKEEEEERQDEEREEERRKERARKERTLLMEAQEVHERKAVEGALAQALDMAGR